MTDIVKEILQNKYILIGIITGIIGTIMGFWLRQGDDINDTGSTIAQTAQEEFLCRFTGPNTYNRVRYYLDDFDNVMKETRKCATCNGKEITISKDVVRYCDAAGETYKTIFIGLDFGDKTGFGNCTIYKGENKLIGRGSNYWEGRP